MIKLRTILFLLLFCEFTIRVNSQNLVINPSFEDTVVCTTVQGTPQRQCAPWFNATNGSPDYWLPSVLTLTNCVGAWSFAGYQTASAGNHKSLSWFQLLNVAFLKLLFVQ